LIVFKCTESKKDFSAIGPGEIKEQKPGFND
jgi:hypothetical protein